MRRTCILGLALAGHGMNGTTRNSVHSRGLKNARAAMLARREGRREIDKLRREIPGVFSLMMDACLYSLRIHCLDCWSRVGGGHRILYHNSIPWETGGSWVVGGKVG